MPRSRDFAADIYSRRIESVDDTTETQTQVSPRGLKRSHRFHIAERARAMMSLIVRELRVPDFLEL
jgi:hypothetical protein